jgi:hypothetical protein
MANAIGEERDAFGGDTVIVFHHAPDCDKMLLEHAPIAFFKFFDSHQFIYPQRP